MRMIPNLLKKEMNHAERITFVITVRVVRIFFGIALLGAWLLGVGFGSGLSYYLPCHSGHQYAWPFLDNCGDHRRFGLDIRNADAASGPCF